MRRKTRKPDLDPAGAGDGADDDGALFRRLMADARRLDHDRALPERRPARPRAKFARRDRAAALHESLTRDPADFGDAQVAAGEHLQFARPSLGRTAMRRLARGGYRVQAELDLHGLTGAEAQAALGRFIADCVEQGLGCVRVIHGKGRGSGHGGPVLKPLVDLWLRRADPVLAFVTARPVDGGTGAVYVLLHRER